MVQKTTFEKIIEIKRDIDYAKSKITQFKTYKEKKEEELKNLESDNE